MRLVAVLLFLGVAMAHPADVSRRVVLTFLNSTDVFNSTVLLDMKEAMEREIGVPSCTLVKQYGRRLVWDLGTEVDLDVHAEAMSRAVAPWMRLADLEVDLFVDHTTAAPEPPTVFEAGEVANNSSSSSQQQEEAEGGGGSLVAWQFRNVEPY